MAGLTLGQWPGAMPFGRQGSTWPCRAAAH